MAWGNKKKKACPQALDKLLETLYMFYYLQ